MNKERIVPQCLVHEKDLALCDPSKQTPEQAWCGTWYGCTEPGCGCTVLLPSPELERQLLAAREKTAA